MMKNGKKKRFYSFWGGVSGLIVGAYVAFYLKNNWGFLIGLIAALMLTIPRK